MCFLQKPQVKLSLLGNCHQTHRDRVRCDRQLPCKTCTSRGIAYSCTYGPGGSRKSDVSVSDRIEQLEALVRSLIQQQQASQASQAFGVHPDGRAPDSTHSLQEMPGSSPHSVSATPAPMHASLPHGKDQAASPAPSESGSMYLNSHGTQYVGRVHWAAVLDSISELRHHYEKEEEARMLVANDHVLRGGSGPRLLYEPVQSTKAELLASIPPRPVMDRMVARYFNAQGVAPAVLHSVQFPQEVRYFPYVYGFSQICFDAWLTAEPPWFFEPTV